MKIPPPPMDQALEEVAKIIAQELWSWAAVTPWSEHAWEEALLDMRLGFKSAHPQRPLTPNESMTAAFIQDCFMAARKVLDPQS